MGICNEVDDNDEYEYIQIIDVNRYSSYINRPENDVVDHNSKDILK